MDAIGEAKLGIAFGYTALSNHGALAFFEFRNRVSGLWLNRYVSRCEAKSSAHYTAGTSSKKPTLTDGFVTQSLCDDIPSH